MAGGSGGLIGSRNLSIQCCEELIVGRVGMHVGLWMIGIVETVAKISVPEIFVCVRKAKACIIRNGEKQRN